MPFVDPSTSIFSPFGPLAPDPSLLPMAAQSMPDVLRIIDQGGSKAVIAVLVVVIAYLARANEKLHATLHERDVTHATKLHEVHTASAVAALARETAHAAEIGRVTEERISELETFTKGAAALEALGKRMDAMVAKAPRR